MEGDPHLLYVGERSDKVEKAEPPLGLALLWLVRSLKTICVVFAVSVVAIYALIGLLRLAGDLDLMFVNSAVVVNDQFPESNDYTLSIPRHADDLPHHLLERSGNSGDVVQLHAT